MIALVGVVIIVPLMLAAWIGLIFLAEDLGITMEPQVIFAWMLSLMVSVVLWPLCLRGLRRYFWGTRGASPGKIPAWGSQKFPAPPGERLSAVQRCARGAAVLLGAVGLLVICGPWQISSGILYGLNIISSGTRSWWLAVQLCTWLLTLGLFLPVLWITDRRLRNIERGPPDRQGMELEQTWWLAAATGWAICVMMGLLFTWLAIDKLS
ncbi:hypothetical protein [Glutamicibacter sp.]|uniref:hypothetical protein n=1 Tax=Glutamicibacter sp. TaxID=1931995 RepID=UPI0028BDFA3A|nr:hypothetical protein [Glutamicibacter sp.]